VNISSETADGRQGVLKEVLVGRGPSFSKLKLQRPSKMNVFSD